MSTEEGFIVTKVRRKLLMGNKLEVGREYYVGDMHALALNVIGQIECFFTKLL